MLFLAVVGPASSSSSTASIASLGAAGSRRLLGGASATKSALQSSDGQPGELTDWVLACQDGRPRCPSLFLASWGFQCANQAGDACCLQPTGKDCTSLDEWADQPTPQAWQGRDLTPAPSPAPANSDNGDNTDDSATDASNDSTNKGDSDSDSSQHGNGKHGGNNNDGDRASAQSSDKKGGSSGSGGKWYTATATYYNSYPPCCHDSSADQSECDDYSGCQWEGQFAALDGKQSKSWVKKNNIVSFFEPPNSQNRKEWDRKWKNKTLRLRNPDTGATLDVKVLDTCDDADCDGCCTHNANKNGGHLVDLEYYTAKRFWGSHIRGMAAIQYQVLG
ncbi:hypothetical protein ABPG77_009414 [Micractinium sp. CCAP 211/92]